MGCCTKLVVITSLIAVVIAALLYGPVHEDIEDKTVMRMLHASNNIMKYVGIIGELAGTHKYEAMRMFSNKLLEMTDNPPEEGTQERNDIFNDVRVKIFEPTETSKSRPGLIFLPGGGFFTGSPESHSTLCGVLAQRLQLVIISVDYRKVPEFPYPAQINDVTSVLNYVNKNADTLGINRDNIGIAGDSSGGTLAATTALKLRDDSHPIKLKYQIIIYPATQGLTLNLPSHHQNDWHAIAINRRQQNAEKILMYLGEDISLAKYVLDGNHTSANIWKMYGHLVDPTKLPVESIPRDYNKDEVVANRLEEREHGISQEAMKTLVDPHAYPLMAHSLENLPPTFLLTCELDPNRDDGVLYAQRLKADNNQVEHYHDTNGFHGMITFQKGRLRTDAGVKALDALVNFVEKFVKK